MLCKVIDVLYGHEITTGVYDFECKGYSDCVFAIYARSNSNKCIRIIVKKFKIFCYIRNDNIEKLFKKVKSLGYKASYEKCKPFEGFCGNHLYDYIKLEFNCHESMRSAVYTLNKLEDYDIHFYETDIDPKIRFIHCTELESAGYLEIDNDCDNITIDYKPKMFKINSEITEQINFKILSFDIECDSYYGEFPLANGSWDKPVGELFTILNKENKTIDYNTFENILGIILSPDYHLIEYSSFFHCNGLSISEIISKIKNAENKMNNKSSELLNVSDQSQWFVNHEVQEANYYNLREYLIKYNYPKLKGLGLHVNLDKLIEQAARIISLDIKSLHFKITPIDFVGKSTISKDFILTKNGVKIAKILYKYIDSQEKFFTKITELLKPRGDHVIQIGSTMTQGERIISKSIFVLNSVDNFTNSELIKLENTFDRHDPENDEMEEDVDKYLKKFDNVPESIKSGSLEDKLKWKINNEFIEQQKTDNADLFIYSFVNNTELLENVINDIIEARKSIYTNEVNVKKYILDNLNKSFIDFLPVSEIAKNVSEKYNCSITDKITKSIEMNSTGNLLIRWGTEKELLLEWSNYIKNVADPDIITGYNIFGFDFEFLFDRAKLLGILTDFTNMGRVNKSYSEITKSKLSTNAYGENNMVYVPMLGRVIIDIFKFVRIEYKLQSYKLDNVCAKFLLKEKADVPPHEIFRKQRLGPSDRKDIAMYCIIDCMLCNRLIEGLKILDRQSALASVSKVPLNYLFLRGQSVKLLSLLTYYCDYSREYKYLIEDKQSRLDYVKPISEGYEGATVLEPVTKLHDIPISVGDFNSLYPNSMIARNLSHDTIISENSEYWDKINNSPDFERLEADGIQLVHSYNNPEKYRDYDETPGILYKTGDESTRTYFVSSESHLGIIPQLMSQLIELRKSVRAKQKDIKYTNPLLYDIYESQQLAAKVLCNSQYGILGATTSKIYNKRIAACTTAIGRTMINAAKGHVENKYIEGKESIVIFKVKKDIVNYDHEIDTYEFYNDNKDNLIYIDSGKMEEEEKLSDKDNYVYSKISVFTKYTKCIYGDTDSIFIQFHNYYNKECSDDSFITGIHAVHISHILCVQACNEISGFVSKPERIEFEKTIWPFIIFAKKRYYGRYYTILNSDKYIDKSMGIITKRRDQAKITQEIYNGILEILMAHEENFCNNALDYFKKRCNEINKTSIHKFVLSKTLKSNYKNRNGIAHAVLADRQAMRDPGNAFSINDRIPYCYFYNLRFNDKTLQGNRVETPEYIMKNNLTIDYSYYIKHQISEPVEQMFQLLEQNQPGILKEFKLFIECILNKCKVFSASAKNSRSIVHMFTKKMTSTEALEFL